MAKTRTFIALEASSMLRKRAGALSQRLRPHAPGATWVEPENLHLTLLFLGDLTDTEVAEACSTADWVARANAPFTIHTHGVGAFPVPDRPRALWLGVDPGEQAASPDAENPLRRLQSDLVDALGSLAPRDTRPFVPHWTLARMSRRGGAPSAHLPEVIAGLADYDAGAQPVDELVVFSSELHPQGPEYYALARCQLGG